ncbi:MAG TPA: hypothetical protein VFK90_17300 [Anaeromyxobacter sp.]|nr:hypothetical protein [Anaeromyxobacter sp.]
MIPAIEAHARAERLLHAHLTAAQREEYTATGQISIVKYGVVWAILLRQLAVVLPIVPLLAVPMWRTLGVVLLAIVVVALAPFWVSRFSLAITRRREWVISGRSAPVLRARGRAVRFCVRFTEDLPAADRVLAWKNLIELSEPTFLKTANVM